MENKNKFIRSFATYSTFAVITGAIVLIETVPGFKADNMFKKNQVKIK